MIKTKDKSIKIKVQLRDFLLLIEEEYPIPSNRERGRWCNAGTTLVMCGVAASAAGLLAMSVPFI